MAAGEDMPRQAEVLVVPQDVHLIMGDVVAVEDTGATLQEVAEGAATDSSPLESGTIVVQKGQAGPLVIQAIVYDFERSPPVRREDVFAALLAAFEETHRRTLTRLAVRPPGDGSLRDRCRGVPRIADASLLLLGRAGDQHPARGSSASVNGSTRPLRGAPAGAWQGLASRVRRRSEDEQRVPVAVEAVSLLQSLGVRSQHPFAPRERRNEQKER